MSPLASPLCLILLGSPGSGKGTHGQFIAKTLHLTHLSTGHRFRREITAQTPLGVLAETYINRGQLVPDTVASRLMKEMLSEIDPLTGFVLDGYPRSLPQGRDLDTMLAQKGRTLEAVFYLQVSDEEVVRRLSGRLVCRDCGQTFHTIFNPPLRGTICSHCGGELQQRLDDRPETIQKRLRVFHQMTEPLIEFYQEKNLLRSIEAEGSPETVRALVAASLQDFRTK